MKHDVIISIRHAFAEKIYSGEKRYELRKRVPKVELGTRCWIYEPKPVGKVTGFFTYLGCFRGTKEEVYNNCKDYIGINREAYMQYYSNESVAHAWLVVAPHRCKPFTLQEAGIKSAPQSYIFTKSDGYLHEVAQHIFEHRIISALAHKSLLQ